MQKYFAEGIATFALVFCGTGAIIIDHHTGGQISHLGVSVVFGLIVMAMIYAVGDISGAHLNPAVSLAFWVAKKIKFSELFPYILAQLIGALLASGSLKILFPDSPTMGETLPAGSDIQSFILEVIITFFLMFVIINVVTGSQAANDLAGVTIGMTVLLAALLAGPICGASMNPARSIAPAIMNNNLSDLWIYLIAPCIGSVLSIFAWRLIRKPV